MSKIVIFGAGNIGRSLVGQIFSKAGYEVVFIDVLKWLVDLLNKKKGYRIEVKDVNPETIWVDNIRAVHAADVEKASLEVSTADIVATAVGPNNLESIYPIIARGLVKRLKSEKRPLDIIICENIRNSSRIFRDGLSKYLPEDYPLDSMVGLVETSIGKMVPIMTEEQKKKDPLLIFAEAYNKIIVDRKAFKLGVPKIEGIEPKDNMAAYVDRKLFIHNMGHAATAYLGYITDPEMKYIWQAIENKHIRSTVKSAMWESGESLIREYPKEFNRQNMEEYIDDLIRRFDNKFLGDTLYRVGRDLPRKLSRNDRLIGALLLDQKNSVSAPCTTIAAAAAMFFRAKDEKGNLYVKDKIFAEEIYPRGIDYILEQVCGLDPKKDRIVFQEIKETYQVIEADPKNWMDAIKSLRK